MVNAVEVPSLEGVRAPAAPGKQPVARAGQLVLLAKMQQKLQICQRNSLPCCFQICQKNILSCCSQVLPVSKNLRPLQVAVALSLS